MVIPYYSKIRCDCQTVLPPSALDEQGGNDERKCGHGEVKQDHETDEQERQQLITETLTKLYGSAAAKYKKTNAEVIRANKATEDWNAEMAELGEQMEPVVTDVKELGIALLKDAQETVIAGESGYNRPGDRIIIFHKFLSECSNSIHYVLSEFTACAAVVSACDCHLLFCKHTDIKSLFKLVCLCLLADV